MNAAADTLPDGVTVAALPALDLTSTQSPPTQSSLTAFPTVRPLSRRTINKETNG
jgi:hypothetical protein